MEEKKRSLTYVLAAGILVLGVYLTVSLIVPPPPIPGNAPANLFSAERALQDLEVIAREPHPMGEFPAHAAVRDYLVEEIQVLGLEPKVQKTFGVRVIHDAWILAGAVENIHVRLPGTNPEGAILLMSHYDSTPGSPGAADSGSGVVAVLETLRALQAGPPLRHDVIALFTDGEEPGTLGAHAFVGQNPDFPDVLYAINMETFIAGSPFLVRSNGGNAALIQALSQAAPKPAYVSLPYHLFPGGDTDLLAFIKADVPSADILASAIVPEIHTMLDKPEIVYPPSLQQGGSQILALVRYLGSQENLSPTGPDATFFPILGRLIHYPISWALPLAVFAGVIALAILFEGFRTRRLTWQGSGLGLLATLAMLAVSLALTHLVWLGIEALHPDYQYSSIRIHLSGDQLYLFGLGFLMLALWGGLLSAVRKRIDLHNLVAGGILFWLILSIASGLLVPESSYLASWGLLAGSLALLVSLKVGSTNSMSGFAWQGFLAAALVMIALWIPVIYTAFWSSGFSLTIMLVGLIGLLLVGLMPILAWLGRPKPWLIPAGFLLAGTGFLLAGHFLVGRNSPPLLVNSIGYWMNPEDDQAQWIAFIGGFRTDAVTTTERQVAFPEEMDQRQTQILTNPIRKPYTEIFKLAPPFSVLTSPAPRLDLRGPTLEILQDQGHAGTRLLQIHLNTSMADRLYVIVPLEARVHAITLPFNEPIELGEYDEAFVLRFDGTPWEGFDLILEVDSFEAFEILLVEEKTGLPVFPGVPTAAQPGSMRSPGEFLQGDATDFTAMDRAYLIPAQER